MADIKYPLTWYNVREGKNAVDVFHGPTQLREQIFVRPGYYDTVGKMLKRLWDSGLQRFKDITLKYDKTSKRVTAQSSDESQLLVLRDDIARICGFENGTLVTTHLSTSYT